MPPLQTAAACRAAARAAADRASARCARERECVCAAVDWWSKLRRCRVTPGVIHRLSRARCACRRCGRRLRVELPRVRLPNERARSARASTPRRAASSPRRCSSPRLPRTHCVSVSRCLKYARRRVGRWSGAELPHARRPTERARCARASTPRRAAVNPRRAALTACCGTCRSCLLLQHWRPCPRPSPRRTCGGRPSDRAVRARARRAERRAASDGSVCCGTCRCFVVSRQPRPRPSPSPRKTRPPPRGALGARRRAEEEATEPWLCGCLPATRVGNFTAQGRHHTGKRRFWRGRTVSPPVALLPPC